MNHYPQLTQRQRYQIYSLNKAGHSQSYIARQIGVDKSTVSRELRRNRGLRGDRPQQAHQRALSRREHKAQSRIGASHWSEVERLLGLYWSPEPIAWRLFTEHGYRIMSGFIIHLSRQTSRWHCEPISALPKTT